MTYRISQRAVEIRRRMKEIEDEMRQRALSRTSNVQTLEEVKEDTKLLFELADLNEKLDHCPSSVRPSDGSD